MRTRQKALLLLALFVAVDLVFAGFMVAGLSRSARAAASLRVAEQTRLQILLQARYVADLVEARQKEQRNVEDEVALLLRGSLEKVAGLLPQLTEYGKPPRLPHRGPRDSHDTALQVERQWDAYRSAAESVLEGRSVLRNHDLVVDNAIDLVNLMTELVRGREAEHARNLLVVRAALVSFVSILVLMAAVTAWYLYRALFRPLNSAVEQIRLISSGEMPLEAQLNLDAHDEFGDFSRHVNAFLERVRRADRMKDRFLATMSHEIRTPMNGVIGFLDNLGETPLTEQQRQYVRVIDSSARALLRVINEVLDFSKLSAGRMTLELVAFDLNRLLSERIEVVREMVRAKSIKVRLDLAPAETLVIRGDPTRLRQVLDNLLTNAAKFTEKGEVRLDVRAERQEGNKVALQFTVADTGPGIPPELQPHLFQPFSQLDTTVPRRHGGTGLGLCIAANLVSLMGGQLRAESQPGEGARFHFRIVTTTAPPEEQVQLSQHYIIKFAPGALKRFWALLVDDTPTNLFLMETICQGIGLPYVTATNGKEAVEKCAKSRFDLVFMDIQMPVMDGYTAIREIRKLETAATTQIVALTASAMQEDVEKALGVGSTGFLAKPFERNQLLQCIAEHLGVGVERELRPIPEARESREELAVRQMYDFMRERYQISLGEIKMILAQSVADWRPHLDDILVFSKKENWPAIRTIMHRLKGQLGAIGLGTYAAMADEANRRIKSGDVAELRVYLDGFVAELGAIFRSVERDITLDQRQSPANSL